MPQTGVYQKTVHFGAESQGGRSQTPRFIVERRRVELPTSALRTLKTFQVNKRKCIVVSDLQPST